MTKKRIRKKVTNRKQSRTVPGKKSTTKEKIKALSLKPKGTTHRVYVVDDLLRELMLEARENQGLTIRQLIRTAVTNELPGMVESLLRRM